MASATTDRRSGCPISFALDIFGDRWTLLVLRDLLLQNKRHFRELLGAEEGIASNILADRLKRLEAYGVIAREADPEDGRRQICRVTDRGIALIPVLLEIAAWGAAYDAQTAAPDNFPATFRADRDAMIAGFVKRLLDA